MNSSHENASPPRTLSERIRRIYLGGRTGRLEITAGGGKRQLYFLSGELYLPGSHPLAVLLRPHLGGGEAGRRTAADAGAPSRASGDLIALMGRIAATVASWEDAEYRFSEGREELPKGLVGPLPTSRLVMDQAVEGVDEAVLLARLGSEEGRFRAVRSDPQIAVEACLSQEELAFLESLQAARKLGDILAEGRPGSVESARQLCRFQAVGLVERLPGPVTDSPAEDVTRAIVRRLASRVGERLLDEPLDLDPEEHRRRLAELLARLGDLTYYELFDLPVDVPAEMIWDAYEKVARLVHPGHAQRLNLGGREGVFEILFERATEAYLTLSDPRRRSDYDRARALVPEASRPADEDRAAERRKLARRHYEQALQMMGSEDFHFAVELLKQAARQDPRPEYSALLGRVLAKNEHPRWQRQAKDNLERALREGSKDPSVPSTLARVCEILGQRAEAVRLYREILERDPDDRGAQEGLVRLTEEGAPEPAGGWWRRLLGS